MQQFAGFSFWGSLSSLSQQVDIDRPTTCPLASLVERWRARVFQVKAMVFLLKNPESDIQLLLLYSVNQKRVTRSSPHQRGENQKRMWLLGGRSVWEPSCKLMANLRSYLLGLSVLTIVRFPHLSFPLFFLGWLSFFNEFFLYFFYLVMKVHGFSSDLQKPRRFPEYFYCFI